MKPVALQFHQSGGNRQFIEAQSSHRSETFTAGPTWVDLAPPPAEEAKDVNNEVHGLKQRLRAFRKSYKWKKHREWPSVPHAMKDGLSTKRTYQTIAGGSIETVIDRPHDSSIYDLLADSGGLILSQLAYLVLTRD